jgi:hypothetical protein
MPIATPSSAPLTRKAKALSVKVFQFIVPVSRPSSGSTMRLPIRPPASPISAASTRKEARIAPRPKPSERSTPISRVRAPMAASIVLAAPRTAAMPRIAPRKLPRKFSTPLSMPVWATK